jgi:hypothetical protein
MIEIPGIARNGKLIETVNPPPEVRKNAEAASDWIYPEKPLIFTEWLFYIKDRFLDPVLLTDRRRLPDPVISFTNLRNKNTLAAYTLVRNPQGLLCEITMNNEHYVTDEQDEKKVKRRVFGKWAQLETLLHEQVHLWQQNFGTDPIRPGRVHHNKEFVEKCEGLEKTRIIPPPSGGGYRRDGLRPMPGVKCHTRLADATFAYLMNELGMSPPDLSQQPDDLDLDWFRWFLDSLGKGRKGTSTLHKWTCPECSLNEVPPQSVRSVHVRWCERGRLCAAPYSIGNRPLFQQTPRGV